MRTLNSNKPRPADAKYEIEETVTAVQYMCRCSRATAVVTMYEMGLITSDEANQLLGFPGACFLKWLPDTGLSYALQTLYTGPQGVSTGRSHD
jgi:hypothetical protein